MITRAEVIAALPEWLTVAEAAALAGVSANTMHNRVKAGKISTDGGRPRRVPKSEVLAYLDERRARAECRGQA